LVQSGPKRRKPFLAFDDACDRVHAALAGPLRGAVVDEALAGRSLPEALRSLRRSMVTHTFRTSAGSLLLDGLVRRWDERTRQDGFHVLQEWDGRRFIEDPIPVLMLDFFARAHGNQPAIRQSCAVLIDYYFLYVLALFVMRVWDDGDRDRNLDRLTGLLAHLQGARGSGLAFVDDAETLLWIAISHYEPDDHAYARLLEKVKTLNDAHQARLARVGAAVLGCHLRWGLPVYYGQDPGRMRGDNVSDYPWLLFSVDVLLRAYAKMRLAGMHGHDRERIVEALLGGLTADPRALLDVPPPASLAAFTNELAAFRQLFGECREDLLLEFEPHRPTGDVYSPLAFHFNFPHNVLIPMVTLALIEGCDPERNVSFNALLERGRAERSPATLARALMMYAARNPERRGGRETPMITWDPAAAGLTFNRTLAVIAEAAGRDGSAENGSE